MINKTQSTEQQKSFEKNTDLIFEFEVKVKTLSKRELESLMKRINSLCLNINPYDSIDLSDEEINILKELKLYNHLGDPFKFTNILLQMIDIIENQLKRKLH